MLRRSRNVWVMLAFVGALVGPWSGWAETLKNIPPTPHRAVDGSTIEDIPRAIEQAARELNWYVQARSPNSVSLTTIVNGRHEARVNVHYDETNFSIEYVSSQNLDYDPTDLTRWRRGERQVVIKGPRIHRNYNRWIKSLAKRIQMRAESPLAATEQPSTETEPLFSVADEIEKLHSLKERGILTPDEYEQQKERLLSQ